MNRLEQAGLVFDGPLLRVIQRILQSRVSQEAWWCVELHCEAVAYGKGTYQCINESRKDIHKNITEFGNHCSSIYVQKNIPGEGKEGGDREGPRCQTEG